MTERPNAEHATTERATAERATTTFDDVSADRLREVFDAQDYVADDDLVTTVLLAFRLGKPLLVEGEPGAGKTELAKVLAAGFDAELVRLQCYEGLTAENALYEWNYTKQLLAVQSGDDDESVFAEEYLLERPLLKALRGEDRSKVLLVDEVDRADEEFEALLLEILSEFQVTIPELGSVRAETPPVVVATSNRTRALSDALKRRCLYLHVSPPSVEKERAILERRVPELDGAIAAELCRVTRRLREEPLRRPPGTAETIDWARAVAALRRDGGKDYGEHGDGGNGDGAKDDGDADGGKGSGGRNGDGDDDANSVEPLSAAEIRSTLGCLLKEVEDVERVDESFLEVLLEAARDADGEAAP